MIGAGIQSGLRQEDHTVDWVQDGAAAELALANGVYEPVLVDLGLPRKAGLEILADLRRQGNPVPVLVITARDAVADRVKGLDTGADDYLVKPFELDEVSARIRAGIQPGDVVLSVNGEPVTGADQLRAAIGKAGKRIALLIQRNDARIFVPVDLG